MITIAVGVFAGIVSAVWFLRWCEARAGRRAMELMYPAPVAGRDHTAAILKTLFWLIMLGTVGGIVAHMP